MATVRFGDVITGIKGSVGGTTYRQFGSGFVIQKRSAGGNKDKLRQNPKLAQLSKVVAEWQGLNTDWREEWATEAELWQFPDKWGNPKNLSAREFFIKFANQAANVGLPTPTPFSITDQIPEAIFQFVSIRMNGTAKIKWQSTAGEVYAAVWANIMRPGQWLGNNKPSRILAAGRIDQTLELNFGEEFFKKYPYAKVDDEVSIYWSYYNNKGWKKIPQNSTGKLITY